MGEKGNALSGVTPDVASVASQSIVERTTTTATTAVVGLGQDLSDTIRDKSIGAVADNVVEAGRDRLSRDDPGQTPPTTPPS